MDNITLELTPEQFQIVKLALGTEVTIREKAFHYFEGHSELKREHARQEWKKAKKLFAIVKHKGV